jgi:hypothetical protein
MPTWVDAYHLRTLVDVPDGITLERWAALVDAACGFVSRYCNRFFPYGTYIEFVYVVNKSFFLHALPIESITSVSHADGTPVTATPQIVNPNTGQVAIDLPNGVWLKVTYTGGMRNIPLDLQFAIAELALFWAQQPAGVTDTSLGGASVRIEAFPSRVRETLDRYRLLW